MAASTLGILLLSLHLPTYALALVIQGGEVPRLESMTGLHFDEEPLELDFSNISGAALRFHRDSSRTLPGPNPKNGTPWYRFKHTSDAGSAGHSHFDGLTATGDFAHDILLAHNVVRERAGVSALAWNGGLEGIASRRVRKLSQQGCYIRHSPLNDRWQAANFHYIGENLYKVINMVPTGVDIVDAWYAEIEDYTYGTMGAACTKERCAHRQSPPCTLGHFTQVMWADTTDVGCAIAECPGEAKRTFVSVCNYGPGGNIVGNMPFGRSCAAELGLNQDDCTTVTRPATPSTTTHLAHSYASRQLLSMLTVLLAVALI